MTNLNEITQGLPKIREVAGWVCSCHPGDFSLSQYAAPSILFVWKSLGITTPLDPGSLSAEEFLLEARKVCHFLESLLVETDFEKYPLLPPYMINRAIAE